MKILSQTLIVVLAAGAGLPAEYFTVTVKGFDAKANFSVYDPILDCREDVRTVSRHGGAVTLELSARDYRVLLEVEGSR
jgi:hypothetical protein